MLNQLTDATDPNGVQSFMLDRNNNSVSDPAGTLYYIHNDHLGMPQAGQGPEQILKPLDAPEDHRMLLTVSQLPPSLEGAFPASTLTRRLGIITIISGITIRSRAATSPAIP